MVAERLKRRLAMNHPYIGITDFVSSAQVEEMLAIFNAHKKPGSQRKLHVGVMTSFKKLHGIPSKWSSVFPDKEEFGRIFVSDETMNCLHYADYDDHPNLQDSLFKGLSFAGPKCNALQLDMVWPNPREVKAAISRNRRNVEVILQVNTRSLEEVGNNPDRLIAVLELYKGVVQRVLLDKSMGKGLGMDAVGLLPFARAIRVSLPWLQIGAAGGLGPTSMELVLPLSHEFPELSIDAQGKLRPSGNALDPIDWSMAGEYIRQALKIFV